MSLIIVNSSSIRAVDYDGNHLFVQFHTSDTIYTHYGVPEDMFHGLMNASSMGPAHSQSLPLKKL
jgi:hypothetical protein